jgi:FKBP-type peptidyl-prolyl cis-trans isomerase FkpA
MKRIILLLLPFFIVVGCIKEKKCPGVEVAAPGSEVATLKTYLDTNHITVTADPRGFFYKINAAGSGTKPNPCSGVTVGYVGRLLNGTVFDKNPNATFGLGELIVGWQESIPLIAPGGSMTVYIPPSLGYGSKAVGSIPANSYLMFDITLYQVF